MNNKVMTNMNVKGNLINVMRVNNVHLIFIHCGKKFLMKILN